jgi:hypothetical protein
VSDGINHGQTITYCEKCLYPVGVCRCISVKEKIYDSQVGPLLSQIYKICKDNKIDMIFDAHLGDELFCTTVLLDKDSPDRMHKAYEILRPR